jgi:hypothetical protein
MGVQLARGQGLVMQQLSGNEHTPAPHTPIARLPCLKTLNAIKHQALLLAYIVASTDIGPFLKKHGIKDKRYGKRLVQQLRNTCSLSQAPRSDRPPKYTEAKLNAAHHTLACPTGPIHTAAALV